MAPAKSAISNSMSNNTMRYADSCAGMNSARNALAPIARSATKTKYSRLKVSLPSFFNIQRLTLSIDRHCILIDMGEC